MNEREANRIIGQWLAEHPGVLGYHHPDSRLATLPGWPDWVFIGRRGILFREFKGSNDVLSLQQRRVGRAIALTGDWAVWGSRDLITRHAQRELTAILLDPPRGRGCPRRAGAGGIP